VAEFQNRMFVKGGGDMDGMQSGGTWWDDKQLSLNIEYLIILCFFKLNFDYSIKIN